MYFGVCLLKVSHVLSKLSHTVCTSKTTFYTKRNFVLFSETGAMDSLSKLQKLRNRITVIIHSTTYYIESLANWDRILSDILSPFLNLTLSTRKRRQFPRR